MATIVTTTTHTSEFDLEGYFARIGYDGPRAATLETLRAVHLHHAQEIAFENLSPFLREGVRIDLASLQEKLVRGGRGGYCYEHNTLFRAALEALGFQVSCLAARVLINSLPGTINPRTHMLLRVELENESYLADVGFGGQTLTGPLRLIPNIVQETPHEPYRLRPFEDELIMESVNAGEWRPLFRFSLLEQFPIDNEVANWYTSAHPDSIFLHNLLLARPTPQGRYALFNHRLVFHRLGGDSDLRTLRSSQELREVLETVFELTLPDHPDLDAKLQRVVTRR